MASLTGRTTASLSTGTSRYKNSRVFFDPDTGLIFFGTWKTPRIILNREPIIHKVEPHQILRPDLIAFVVYEDPELWWPIAVTNGIFNALVEIEAGQILTCPHLEDVSSALAVASENAAGVV